LATDAVEVRATDGTTSNTAIIAKSILFMVSSSGALWRELQPASLSAERY